MSLRAAQVRFYIDADLLGLGKILGGLRNDVTYPGDLGAVLHKRHRASQRRGLNSKRTASGVSEPTGAELPPLCVRLLLQAAPARPYVLDDATVVRIIRVHRDQAEDLTLLQNQADRWKPDLA